MSEKAHDPDNDRVQSSAAPEKPKIAPFPRDLHHRSLYINRELSWLDFNRRVLEEALDIKHPLLERVKFLSIFGSNLDEFFMIRVSGLRHQLERGVLESPPDGMSPSAQLAGIRERLLPMLETVSSCWSEDLRPKLRDHGVNVLSFDELGAKQKKTLRKFFKKEIFPALTPLAFDPSHPFPHVSNLSLNLAVIVEDPVHGQRFARVKVPHMFSRLVRVREEKASDAEHSYRKLGLADKNPTFVLLEEVVASNLDLLFPGLTIKESYPFRVTRDADFEIEEDEASDLLSEMKEVVDRRYFGSAIRLEISASTPKSIRDILKRNLGLAPYQVYSVEGPLGISGLMELTKVDRPELKDPPFVPFVPPAFNTDESIFNALDSKNHLLHHPFHSFGPVVDFLQQAATDPDVLAIKQTLYRVGQNSPIVEALMAARENGKQVAVLVELKARFDEANNIVWARSLEEAGVHVVYGVFGLKTHTKMTMVVRRKKKGISRFIHLGSGNYNPETARLYTDFGYFTKNPEIASDVSDLFNALTGYSRKASYERILVAPHGMREGIIERIEREIAKHEISRDGRIIFKMNSLVDGECIRALYRASQAGVTIDLIVRGICCLRPGIEGISENITVTSIVGRFLEHSRAFYFYNGGDEELLMGSADLMPRNLVRRVECLFPIEEPEILAAVRDRILHLYLRDNVHARILLSDGSYVRKTCEDDTETVDAQQRLIDERETWM